MLNVTIAQPGQSNIENVSFATHHSLQEHWTFNPGVGCSLHNSFFYSQIHKFLN